MRIKISGAILLAICMLYMSGAWVDAKPVKINEENFPNPAFRAYLAEQIDLNGDRILSDEELRLAEEFYYGFGITMSIEGDLTGIEHLYNLKKIEIVYVENLKLPLDKLKKLEYLDIWGGGMEKMDFSKNINLKHLALDNEYRKTKTPLKEINISQNTKLKELIITGNKIKMFQI